MKKRIISILLAVMMVLTMMPLSTEAAYSDPPSGLKQTDKNDGIAVITWNSVPNVYAYQIIFTDDMSNWPDWKDYYSFADHDNISHYIFGLTNGKKYYVKIRSAFKQYTAIGGMSDENGNYQLIFSSPSDVLTVESGLKSYTASIVNKAANPMGVKTKTVSVQYSKLRKKKQIINTGKAFAVSGAQGKVTFKVSKYDKKAKKRITVSKTGKVTVKKGLKKGLYKVKVKVMAAGNANYNAATKVVTLKVKVK